MIVLIVDRSSLIKERLAASMFQNVAVRAVYQGKDETEAGRILKRIVPDVIVIDLEKSWKKGLAFVKNVKETYPKTTIVALTSSTIKQYRGKGYGAGVDYFCSQIDGLDTIEKILKRTATGPKYPGRRR